MRDLVDKAVVQGYEAQNKYDNVKWNWTGGVASEPNAEPTAGSTHRAGVWILGILYGWAQLLQKVCVRWTYLKKAAVQWQIRGEAVAAEVSITNSLSAAQIFQILTLPLS